jgi:hypothetical protein
MYEIFFENLKILKKTFLRLFMSYERGPQMSYMAIYKIYWKNSKESTFLHSNIPIMAPHVIPCTSTRCNQLPSCATTINGKLYIMQQQPYNNFLSKNKVPFKNTNIYIYY